MRVRPLVALLLALPASFAAAENDCALGQRYLLLARDRMASFAREDALVFLRQSIAACPTYDGYQHLGELEAQSDELQDKVAAAEAFVSAYDMATTGAARARTLFGYAELLNRDRDPQNAYPLIKAAAKLDSASQRIAALERTIEEQIRNPTVEHLRQGLKSQIYRPLIVAGILSSKTAAMQAKVATPIPSGRGLNIQINFVTDSTVVDEQTRPNLRKLVEVLRDPEFASQTFVFVGHADARGDEQRNMVLSLQRAEAIYNEVLQANPGLQGRVQVTGRGEFEPLDFGNDDDAHRANRRLQVLLK